MTQTVIFLVVLFFMANSQTIRFRWNFNDAHTNPTYSYDLITSHSSDCNGYKTSIGIYCDVQNYIDLLSVGDYPYPLSIVIFAFVPPGMSDPIIVYNSQDSTVDKFTINSNIVYERCISGSSTTYYTSGMSIAANEWVALGITITDSTISYFLKHQGGSLITTDFNPYSKSYSYSGRIIIGHDISGYLYSERVIINQIFICDPITTSDFVSLYSNYGFESLPVNLLSDKNYLVYFLPSTSGQAIPDSGDSSSRSGHLGYYPSEDSEDPSFIGSDGLEFFGYDTVYTELSYALPLTKGVSMWLYFPCNYEQQPIIFNSMGGSGNSAELHIFSSMTSILLCISYSCISDIITDTSNICEKWTFVYVGILQVSDTQSYYSYSLNSYNVGTYSFDHPFFSINPERTYFGFLYKGKIRYISVTSTPKLSTYSKGHHLYSTVDSPFYTFCTERQYLDVYGICITCNLRWYPDFYAQSCLPCLTNCSVCTGSNDCSECIADNFFNNTASEVKCLNPCPPGFFKNTTSKNCEPCFEHCEVCSDNTSCTFCFENYYFYPDPSDTCISDCPLFYYGNTALRECRPCIPQCQSCSSDTSCDECFLGYYINTVSSVVNSCELCMSNCFNCSSENDCVSCNNTYYLHSAATPDQCLGYCPDFYYEESNMTCQSCIANCKTCDNSTQCITCDSSYFRYRPISGNDQCVNPCISFYYEDTDQTCQPCRSHCEDCTNGTRCVNCESSYYILDNKNGTDSCVTPCPDYYYENETFHLCQSCLTNCAKCDNNTICNSCGAGFFLYRETNDTCVYPCPTYFFESSDGICAHCFQYCQECTSATNCQTCDTNYFLDTFSNGTMQCVNPCREGYYESGGICSSCLSNCKTCTNFTICLECFPPYSIKHSRSSNTDTCVSDCGMKYYASSNRVCNECDFRCLTCYGNSNSQCPDCDFSYEGVARTSPNTCDCSLGYVTNETAQECKRCDDTMCEVCSLNDLSSCASCKLTNPSIVHDPITMSCVCKAGKYRSDSLCLSCDTLCSECTGPSNKKCKPSKCKNSAFPIETNPTTCLYMCKTVENNMFLELDLEICKMCVLPCQACFAANAQSCTSCIEGYLLMESTCVDRCPSKFYNSSNVCLPCDAKCKDCVERTNYCINGCEEPYLYKNHQCLESCGDGFTGVKGFCETCNSGCQLCYTLPDNTTKVCTKCVSGKFLYKGECSAVCPIGRYGDVFTGKCELCAEACSSCFNGTFKDCVTCASSLGYIKLSENTCAFPACLEGYYFNKTFIKCTACPYGCATCENSTSCLSCIKGYILESKSRRCMDECNKVGFQRNAATFECQEICGDGRNMGELECDDGNTRPGDGCDPTCKVEDYYECSGGDSNHPDTCVERRPPYLYSIKYYSNRTVVLTFNEIISISSSLSNLIVMHLENCEDSSVSWELEPVNLLYTRKLSFHLSFNHSLTGSEELVIVVKDRSKVKDLNENQLRDTQFKVQVKKYVYISDAEKASAENSGKASLYAMLPSLALSLGMSLVFNTPIEGMWATISVIQMMSYLTLIDLVYPSNMLVFFDCLESVHNFNKWLPNPFTYLLKENSLIMDSYSSQFEERGFTNRHMVFLCGSDLLLLALTTLVIFSLIPLSHVCNVFDTLLNKLRWSSVVRSFIQAYLKICLAIFVNIGIFSFHNWQSSLSSMLSILVGSVLICLPAYISEFLYINYDAAKNDPSFKKRHASYLSGFRIKANVLNAMYYPIFLFRRVVFSASIVILFKYPQIQLAFIQVGTILMIFYLLYWKPFGNKYSLYSAVNAEILFCITTFLLYGFGKNRLSENNSSMMGWAIIGLTVCSLAISWICMIVQQIRTWLKKRKQNAPEEAIEQEKQNVNPKPDFEKNIEQPDQLETFHGKQPYQKEEKYNKKPIKKEQPSEIHTDQQEESYEIRNTRSIITLQPESFDNITNNHFISDKPLTRLGTATRIKKHFGVNADEVRKKIQDVIQNEKIHHE